MIAGTSELRSAASNSCWPTECDLQFRDVPGHAGGKYPALGGIKPFATNQLRKRRRVTPIPARPIARRASMAGSGTAVWASDACPY